MTYSEWLASHVNKWGDLPSPGEAWQAAERDALERAVEVCERLHAEELKRIAPILYEQYDVGADDCVNAIRALIEQDKKETK